MKLGSECVIGFAHFMCFVIACVLSRIAKDPYIDRPLILNTCGSLKLGILWCARVRKESSTA